MGSHSLRFGKTLKHLREKAGITQSQLAEKLDVGVTTISNYETGRNEPNIKKLIIISKTFNISLDYLLSNETIYQDKEATETDNRILLRLKHLTEEEKIFIYNIINLIINQQIE